MLNNRSQNVNKLLRGDTGHLPHAGGTGTQGSGKRMSITGGFGELSTEDFADALDGALGSIAALRRNIDNFDPTGTGSEGVGSPSHARRNSTGLSREDLREQRERIEAYKMARKVEPELPPLQRSPPKPPRQAPATDILLRNASPEALKSVCLKSKKEQVSQNLALKEQRAATAAALRQAGVNHKAELILEKLEQKAQQGARAAAMRRSNQPKSMQDARDFRKEQMLEKWMAACMAGGFLRQVLEEVKVRRMTDKERMEYLQNTEELSRMRKSTNFLQQAVKEAESIKEIESKPELVRKLGDVATRVQYMLRRHRIRQDAKVVVACLKEWRIAGRTFVHLKHFAQRVVKMQQWWRRVSAQLEEVRERISKRWEKLEMGQVTRELAKAAPPPLEKSRRNVARTAMLGGLTMEDRVKNAMLPEEMRIRFLRNELRARRYALLPEIVCWEEDLSNWRKDMQQWHEQCEAHRALGLSNTSVVNAPLLKWPPARPTHLPKGHLPEEELRGCECPSWCPGRKGDEEILDMYRRCKQNKGEGGWMKVEVAKNSKGTSKRKTIRAPTGPTSSGAGGVADLTVGMEVVVGGDDEPHVEEEELRKWGVSADRLPGASKVPPDRGNRA